MVIKWVSRPNKEKHAYRHTCPFIPLPYAQGFRIVRARSIRAYTVYPLMKAFDRKILLFVRMLGTVKTVHASYTVAVSIICTKEWYSILHILHFLEQRQYKNSSIQSTLIPILKLPLFFITYTARGKAQQFQNWNFPDRIESLLYCLSSNSTLLLLLKNIPSPAFSKDNLHVFRVRTI